MPVLARTQLLTISATAALAFGAVGPSVARAAGGPPPAPSQGQGPAAPERHRGPHHRGAPAAQTLSVTVPTWQSRAARQSTATLL